MALQALYRVEMTGDQGGEGVEFLWHHFEAADPEARRFAAELVRGVVEEREKIDELIAQAARHYRLERLSRVDLNVLRLAVHELRHPDDRVPTSVVFDEAIEIARRFGSENSSQFVNGVLDSIAGRLGVRDRGVPSETPS